MSPSSTGVFDRIGKSFQLVFRYIVPLFLFPFVILLVFNTLGLFFEPRINTAALNDYLDSSKISAQEANIFRENLEGVSGASVLFAIGLRNEEEPQDILNRLNTVIDVRASIIWISVIVVGGGILGIALTILLIQFVAALYHDRYLLWPENLSTLKTYAGQYVAVIWYAFIYGAIYPFAGAVILLATIILSYYTPSLSATLAFAGGIVFIFSMIKGAIRQLRVFASLYIAVDEDKKPKEAVKESIQLSHGRWFRTVGNFIILILSQWIVAFILELLSVPFLNAFSNSSLVSSILPSLLNAFSMGVTVVFTYLLLKAYRQEQNNIQSIATPTLE